MAAAAALWFYGTSHGSDVVTDDPDAAMLAARRLAEQEKAFRVALVQALPEPAVYIDALGKVEAANPAARKAFRFVGAEPQLTAVVRRPELLDAVADARLRREPQWFEFVERDETDRYFAAVAAPLGAGILISMHDLTAIKRAEFARVDFLANASHELRTPLTSLSGFIETLRGPARDDAEARDRFLEIMQGQAERMRRLISDLLSLSRIELAEHRTPDEEADLAGVVREVVAAMAPVAITAEFAKNDHAITPMRMKNGKPGCFTPRMYLNATVYTPTSASGFTSDQMKPSTDPRYFSFRSLCTRLRISSRLAACWSNMRSSRAIRSCCSIGRSSTRSGVAGSTMWATIATSAIGSCPWRTYETFRAE